MAPPLQNSLNSTLSTENDVYSEKKSEKTQEDSLNPKELSQITATPNNISEEKKVINDKLDEPNKQEISSSSNQKENQSLPITDNKIAMEERGNLVTFNFNSNFLILEKIHQAKVIDMIETKYSLFNLFVVIAAIILNASVYYYVYNHLSLNVEKYSARTKVQSIELDESFSYRSIKDI